MIESDIYLPVNHQMGSGRYLFPLYFYFPTSVWRFCAFLNKGSSKTRKHHKNVLGKVHVKNLLPKKCVPPPTPPPPPPVVFPLRFFLIAFLAVSLHGELKNTIHMLSKIKQAGSPIFLFAKHHCMLSTVYPPLGR
jgi:hypothetical protein